MLKLCCNNNGVKTLNFTIFIFNNPLFYSTSSSTSIKKFPFLANYLVDHLGFSKQRARSTSAKFELYPQVNRRKIEVSSSKFVSNADLVVEFLRQNGLNNSQIRIVVSSFPAILLSGVDKTLKPKIDYFLKLGFSKFDLAEVVSFNPFVLVNGERQIVRSIEALKDVMGNDKDVIHIMKKSYWKTVSGMSNHLMSNVALLRSYGVPIQSIRERILLNSTLYLRKPVIFKDLLIRVEEYLGFPRNSPRFLDGIHLMSCLSEKNIESKIRMFEKFGCMRSDVLALIRKNPYCLALSEARIKRSLEYLMKELGYSPAYVISHGALLSYSLEKRIIPRNKILLALKENGLIKISHALYNTLSLTEPRFLKRYVLPFEEVHEFYAKLTGHSHVKYLNEGRAGEKFIQNIKNEKKRAGEKS